MTTMIERTADRRWRYRFGWRFAQCCSTLVSLGAIAVAVFAPAPGTQPALPSLDPIDGTIHAGVIPPPGRAYLAHSIRPVLNVAEEQTHSPRSPKASLAGKERILTSAGAMGITINPNQEGIARFARKKTPVVQQAGIPAEPNTIGHMSSDPW